MAGDTGGDVCDGGGGTDLLIPDEPSSSCETIIGVP
jgi:hypothetical protein